MMSIKKPLLAIGIFCSLCLSFTSAESSKTNQYYLKIKASNKYERTTVANTGVSIEDVGSDYVMAFATASEKSNLEEMGLVLSSTPVDQNFQGLDFPAADSDYHNYSETVGELNKLIQEFPGVTKLF